MSIPRILVQLPFAGLNTIADPKNAAPGTYTEINNSIMTQNSQLIKRNGTNVITESLTNVRQAYSLNTEQGVITDSQLQSFDPVTNAMIVKGTTIAPSVNASPIIANTFTQTFPDYGISANGLYGSCWQNMSGAGVHCTIQSTYNGGFLVSNYLLDTQGFSPRVVGAGNYLVFFWARPNVSSGYELVAQQYNTLNNTFQGSMIIVEPNLTSSFIFDTVANGNNVVITAATTTSSPDIIWGYYWNTQLGAVGNNSYGLPAPISLGLANANSALVAISLAIDPTNQYIVVSYIGNTNQIYTRSYHWYLQPLAAEIAVTTGSTDNKVIVSTCLDAANNTYFFYSTYNSYNNSYQAQVNANITSPTVFSNLAFINYMSVVSKAWYYDGRPHIILNYYDASGLQNTYFGLTFAGDCFARIFTAYGGEGITVSHPPISVIPIPGSPDTYSTCLLRDTRLSSSGTGFAITSSLYNVTLNYTYQFNSAPVQLNGNLNICGSYLHEYDGSTTIYEQGFHLFPEAPTLSQSTVMGGGLTVGGSYEYVICWEWQDNAGLLHRSTPSIGTNITLTSDHNTVSVSVPPLPLTAKTSRFNNTRSNVVMAVYRTQSLGTTLYRVNPLTVDFVYNNPASVAFLTFTDKVADTVLANNAILYTNGGVFNNIVTPAANLQIVSKNRLWLADVDLYPNQVFPSKQLQPGIAAEFNSEASIFIDGLGGKITALASMDDNVFFFKHALIFYVGGDGPDATGNNGSFTVPTLVSSDVGCPYPNSVILTKTGIMFQSNKGIYQIDQSFNVTWIGAPVQAYTNVDETYVTSATTDPDLNLVYFALNTGIVLVYNTFFGTWFTQTYPTTINAMTWSQYGFLLASATSLYQYNDASYLDGNAFVPSMITTAWVLLNQIEGFGRIYNIYLAGDNADMDHRLVVNIYYDYETNPRQTVSIVPNSLTGNAYGVDTPYGNGSPFGGFYDGTYQFQIRPLTQKCSAIRLEILDQNNSGNATQSFKLSGITFDVGIKPTGNKNLSPKRRLT